MLASTGNDTYASYVSCYGAIDLLDIVKRMIGTGEEIHDLEDFEYVVDDFLRVEI